MKFDNDGLWACWFLVIVVECTFMLVYLLHDIDPGFGAAYVVFTVNNLPYVVTNMYTNRCEHTPFIARHLWVGLGAFLLPLVTVPGWIFYVLQESDVTVCTAAYMGTVLCAWIMNFYVFSIWIQDAMLCVQYGRRRYAAIPLIPMHKPRRAMYRYRKPAGLSVVVTPHVVPLVVVEKTPQVQPFGCVLEVYAGHGSRRLSPQVSDDSGGTR